MSAVRHAICVLGCLALAGAPASATAAAPAAVPAANAPAHPAARARADKALAETEARATLGELQLPPGASSSAGEPAGDGGYLAPPMHEEQLGLVSAHAWWVVPTTPLQVLEYIHAHPPAESGPFFLPTPLGSNDFDTIRWPPGAGEIAERELLLSVAQLPGGTTGVLADARVLWVRPRVPIPPGARVLRVTYSGRLAEKHYTITAQRRIARARRLINALPVERPSFRIRSCPPSHERLQLAFLPRRGAAPFAEAELYEPACGGMTLTVHGHEQPPLRAPTLGVNAFAKPLGLTLEPRLGQ
jgi:hypothetical protein